jgi:hypothetical protein
VRELKGTESCSLNRQQAKSIQTTWEKCALQMNQNEMHWRIKVKDALSVSKVKRGFQTKRRSSRSLLFLSNGRANYGEIFFASRALA